MARYSKLWLLAGAVAVIGCNASATSPGASAAASAGAPGVASPGILIEKPRAVVPAVLDSDELALLQPAPKGQPPATSTKAPPFAFAPDAGGKLLAERLAPARPATPLPFVERPNTPRVMEMERAGTQGTWLVPLSPTAPRGLMPPAASGKPLPLIDVPPLATSAEFALPAMNPFPTLARAYAPSPDPDKVPPLPPGPRAAEPRPTPASDPTADASLTVLLSSSSGGRSTAAPPIVLEIPDPFRLARSLGLRAPPAEVSAPFAPTSAPRPTLPVEAPKAETKTGGG